MSLVVSIQASGSPERPFHYGILINLTTLGHKSILWLAVGTSSTQMDFIT